MWLLESSVRDAIEAASIANALPNADQQAQFEANNISALSDGGSRILTIAGNSAEINIKGVMTETPSFLAMLFGGGNVTYGDIISAIAEVNQNDNITDADMIIDSSGGTVDGLFDAMEAVRNSKKPINVIVRNKAASAAFMLASVATSIKAANAAAMFGSIGVVVNKRIDKFSVDVTSTKAPKKRIDASTEEGRAMIREELDPVHDLFIDAIATGRNTSVDNVNANFGQGSMILAEEALKRCMIDSVAGTQLQSKVKTTIKTKAVNFSGGENIKVKSMDLAKLRAEHPAVYAACVQVGHDEGVAAERDRVGAHLTMGESSGDMKTAITACKDGTAMTATLQATYMAAGMNRNDTQDREDDDDAAAAAAAANAEDDKPETDAEAVAAGLEAHFGTEVK